jgi:hypothetical protein
MIEVALFRKLQFWLAVLGRQDPCRCCGCCDFHGTVSFSCCSTSTTIVLLILLFQSYTLCEKFDAQSFLARLVACYFLSNSNLGIERYPCSRTPKGLNILPIYKVGYSPIFPSIPLGKPTILRISTAVCPSRFVLDTFEGLVVEGYWKFYESIPHTFFEHCDVMMDSDTCDLVQLYSYIGLGVH